MQGSPLYDDTFALAGVLLEELEHGREHPELRRRVASGALALLDAVTLALGGFERHDRLVDADAELRTLRTQVRLARNLGMLTDESALAIAEQTESIGRQIGGWLRRLESVS